MIITFPKIIFLSHSFSHRIHFPMSPLFFRHSASAIQGSSAANTPGHNSPGCWSYLRPSRFPIVGWAEFEAFLPRWVNQWFTMVYYDFLGEDNGIILGYWWWTTLWLYQTSNWKFPSIVDFLINLMVACHSYVSLPEDKSWLVLGDLFSSCPNCRTLMNLWGGWMLRFSSIHDIHLTFRVW